MTEKHYGGASSFGAKDGSSSKTNNSKVINKNKDSKKLTEKDENYEQLSREEVDKLEKAGQIAKETIAYAKSFIKPGIPLLEIAEKIESKIVQLGGKPAFPVNLSMNEIAAHSTPLPDSVDTASGLLKVDLGVHIEGLVADTAFSLDLENSAENKALIAAAENALKSACSIVKEGIQVREIGKAIENEIKKSGFTPIQNLSGHSIELYELHAGITIPNYDNAQEKPIESGVYAIEPFSTSGLGKVRDGKPSSIYSVTRFGNVRDSFSRSVLAYIEENYSTLPFCTRWLHKEFGSRIVLALRNLEQSGILHQYPILIESGSGKVAQAENTVIILPNKKIITTQ